MKFFWLRTRFSRNINHLQKTINLMEKQKVKTNKKQKISLKNEYKL